MRLRAKERDERQKNVLSMRDNDYAAVKAGLLPDEFPEPLVANLIDTAEHDLAEVMAPLPAISCASSSQVTQSKKDFANKRALIANSYVQRSRLADQMYLGADRYSTFGYMAYIVEPDFDESVPVIRVDDALNSYFACDYMGRVVQYVSICKVSCEELCIMFPDYEDAFKEYKRNHNDELEIAERRDKD